MPTSSQVQMSRRSVKDRSVSEQQLTSACRSCPYYHNTPTQRNTNNPSQVYVTSGSEDAYCYYADCPCSNAGSRWRRAGGGVGGADEVGEADVMGGAGLNNSNINDGKDDVVDPVPNAKDHPAGTGPVSGPSKASVDRPRRGSKPTTGISETRRPSLKTPVKSKTSTAGKFSKRKAPAGNVVKTYDDDSSGSRSRSSSFQFEIDLLNKVSDTSGGADAAEGVASCVDEGVTEADQASQVTTNKPTRSLKGLFKQLMTIGMTSNAFRGITVKTSSGESKAATEKEANDALNAMVTDIIPDDDEEEEDDEGDVEVVMGSLLCGVGAHITVEAEAPTKPKPKAKTLKPPDPVLSKTMDEATTNIPAAQEPSREPTTGQRVLDLSSMENLLMAKPSEEETGPKDSETDNQKSFLQDVVSGSAFAGSKPVKSAGGAKTAEPKKKILKIPPIRLRKTIPPADPSLLCIRTPNVELSYEQVKNMLDAQLGNIATLQHVPEYLQNGVLIIEPRVMWIFRMEDTSTNNYVRICNEGIMGYDAETLRIRLRDDIFTEEYRAFQLVQQIKDEQARMNKKSKGKNPVARSRSPMPT